MDLNLQNRIALITGASQGIGKEIAKQLAKEGAYLVITSNDEKNLALTVEEISDKNNKVIAISGDATSESDLNDIVNKAIQQFGRIDILVNNVGNIGKLSNFENFSSDEWLHLFKLNVMSGVILTKLVTPSMRDYQKGRVLFIASEKAIEPGFYLSPYSMTKAAILSVAKSLANELGKDGITVNCISPGVILTPAWDFNAQEMNMTRKDYAAKYCQNVLTNEAHLGMPFDVAMLACFLCSDLARWITGSNFRVDGGSVKSVQM